MSDRTWKELRKGYNPDYREYVRRHTPTRAPWWARFIGIFSPAYPVRILADRVRQFRVEAKAIYKKRYHEAKADKVAFEEKYAPEPLITMGGKK
ncbi:MAG: hypothetical protein KKB59_10430 [Spirochaetes bacterium]|nr:hypothetical protein [Spirochaetota bacterium]